MKKILLIVLICYSNVFALTHYVPIEDPVYDFLERQAVRGLIPELMNDTRPLQRDDIAMWLVRIYDVRDRLHRTERDMLKAFMGEYRHELSSKKHPSLNDENDFRLGIASWRNFKDDIVSIFKDDLYKEKNHIYVMEDGDNAVWIDADFKVRVEGRNNTLRFMDQLGAYAAIQMGEHLSMFVDGYFFHQYVPDNWPEPVKEFKGNWFNLGGDVEKIATWDRSLAYANASGKFGTLTIAHYPVVWGNSMRSMILSEDAVPFGSVQWAKRFKNFKYNFLHGSLMPPEYTLTENGREYIPKYLVGHRIEINFSPRFHFNFSELIIYGNRIPEITYLVPTIFLWPSEHTLGDRDNKIITLEAEYFPVNGLKLYGSLLMDELAFGYIFKDWWANKYGLQAGFQWSPRSLPADLIVEATAVHPWTYTHKYSFGSYTHHGRDLGFFLGPNSQLLSAKLNYDISVRNRVSFTFDHIVEGADSIDVGGIRYPSGGNSNQNYEEMSMDLEFATKWLMGDITKTNSFRLEWLYRLRNQISFLSTCEIRNIRGVSDIYYSLQVNLNY